MSTNFVDLIRSSYAAFARGDLDFLIAHADSEIEIVERPDSPGARTFYGHEGLLEALDEMDNECGEPERFIDAGHERVIVVVSARGRRNSSGGVDLYTGRDGKCIRWEMFGKLDDAFAAIGLRKLKGET